MIAGTRQLFIYYRIGAHEAGDVIAAVREMQRALCMRHDGLKAELLQRPRSDTTELTLMETYAIDAAVSPPGIDTTLAEQIEALGARIVPARHVEVFDTCA